MSEINVNGGPKVYEAENTVAQKAVVQDAVKAASDHVKTVEAGVTEMFEGFNASIPEALRAMAEKNVKQTRESYENSKGAMEDAVVALERSFDSAGQGAAALNRKVIALAQTNLNTGFDLAKDMASAKNIAELMELQASFVRNQFGALTAQAEEISTLASRIAADTSNPIKDHVSQSIEKVMAR